MTAARRIGILAGGGFLPREIADSVAARGMPLHIVGIEGETDADFGPYPVTRVNWGQIGRMVAAFKENGCTDLVIIGSVTRPDLGTIKPDLGFARALGTVLGLVLSGGDDAVLRGVIRFFEGHGFRVIGPAEIAPELVVGAGHFTQHSFAPETVEDIATGFYVIGALGSFDIGQAAVVTNGRLEALEAAEGTDGMLARLAVERQQRGWNLSQSAGVLVKRSKPGQDTRIDLPVIGPRTVWRASNCGIVGIAVEAGRALVAERNELLARAAASRLAVAGFEIDGNTTSAATGLTGRRPSLSARVRRFLRASRSLRGTEVSAIGKHALPGRSFSDAQKGLDVMSALVPMGGSRAVVVVRGHVLAVEVSEGVVAAVKRAAGLRQWGDRRLKRRSGVVVVDAGRECFPELIEDMNSAGFAGIVVKLRRFTAGVPPETIAAADQSGIAVAGIPADDEGGHE